MKCGKIDIEKTTLVVPYAVKIWSYKQIAMEQTRHVEQQQAAAN